MATKTLTITEDAYERLAMRKEKNDSFSDVIVKHFPRHSLMELAGILSHDEAEEMRKHIAEGRARSRKRMELIAKRMK
ncbi:antitoxin VapB family protein [Candidatus Woesearchaeota archaeon]|nr:antitoxin VapB family protein [Candidatus Woesearchaeota archaeon]